MKSFSNIQELWEYCLFCPICQKENRNIIVSMGPEYNIKVIDHDINNGILEISCTYKYIYPINFKFNCVDNTFVHLTQDNKIANEILQESVYLYIQGICKKCKCSAAFS